MDPIPAWALAFAAFYALCGVAAVCGLLVEHLRHRHD